MSLSAIGYSDEANEMWESHINFMADRGYAVKLVFSDGTEREAYLRSVERDEGGMPVLVFHDADEYGLNPGWPTAPLDAVPAHRAQPEDVTKIEVY